METKGHITKAATAFQNLAKVDPLHEVALMAEMQGRFSSNTNAADYGRSLADLHRIKLETGIGFFSATCKE